jgi:hypothetical protein
MTEKERAVFNSKGIFTVTQLLHLPAPTPTERTQGQTRAIP